MQDKSLDGGYNYDSTSIALPFDVESQSNGSRRVIVTTALAVIQVQVVRISDLARRLFDLGKQQYVVKKEHVHVNRLRYFYSKEQHITSVHLINLY